MPGHDEVFQISRWKSSLLFLICLIMIFGCIYLFQMSPEDYSRRTPPEPITKALTVVAGLVFAFWGALSFANVVEPSRLVLNPAGFRIDGPKARELVPWSEVDHFFVGQYRNSLTLRYRLRTPCGSGVERGLPTDWEDDVDTVAIALNRWLKIYGTS